MFVAMLVAQALVSPDWTTYRAGSRDCRMRKVDPVSKMIMFGGADCVPKKGRVISVPLTPTAGDIHASLFRDTEMPSSAPQKGLVALFPGPTTLRIWKGAEVIAETMGSMREIIGLAVHGESVIVVYTYENSVSGKREREVLGIKYSEKGP